MAARALSAYIDQSGHVVLECSIDGASQQVRVVPVAELIVVDNN